jgi:hypothetical protein
MRNNAKDTGRKVARDHDLQTRVSKASTRIQVRFCSSEKDERDVRQQ